MTEKQPEISDELKAQMRKQAPGDSGNRILEAKKEQLAMARERLKNLDRNSPDFPIKSEVLKNLIKRYENEKITP